jgi:deazaflavin-dependent oxidoreductase (nitroreductase family)
MTTTSDIKLPGTPKPWMNQAMQTMLGLPLLGRLLGGSFAVITVTGAKTGRAYTTPVQYMRLDDEYVVLSQRHRVWWRNIRTRPEVELSIAGSAIAGRARLADGEDARRVLSSCLADNPRVAKFYGFEPDEAGSIAADDIERLAEWMVAIVITPR